MVHPSTPSPVPATRRRLVGRLASAVLTLGGCNAALGLTGLLALGAVGGGCAEIITYSNRSASEGKTLLAQGNYEEAAGAFRDAVRQNPRNYEAHYNLGRCYEQLNRQQEALQSYRAAIDVLPERINAEADPELMAFRETAIEALAQATAKSAARDAEVAALTQRVEAGAGSPRRAIDAYILARAYAALGDADSAIDAYELAMTAAGRSDQRIAKSYGLYLLQVNQTARAQQALTEAYRLGPTDADVNAALRRLGVVPGPSLLNENQLNRPLIPKGPIPEIELNVRDSSRPRTSPQ